MLIDPLLFSGFDSINRAMYEAWAWEIREEEETEDATLDKVETSLKKKLDKVNKFGNSLEIKRFMFRLTAEESKLFLENLEDIILEDLQKFPFIIKNTERNEIYPSRVLDMKSEEETEIEENPNTEPAPAPTENKKSVLSFGQVFGI